MYIYQNGKLYVRKEDNALIGVEIYPDKGVFEVEGTETQIAELYEECTPYEVKCRFQLEIDNPYLFPKEVIDSEPIIKAKGTRKPKGK